MLQQQIGGAGAAPPMCTAGCGFFGSPTTLGMCSVCYKKHCCTMTVGPGAATAFDTVVARPTATAVTLSAAGSAAAAKPAEAAAPAPAASICLLAPAIAKGAVAEAAGVSAPAPEAAATAKKKAPPSRCAACWKKVGLTGFVCRCGKTFCGSHRYAEEHGCSFDFKGASRDAIARANPVIKAEKLAGKI